MHIDTTLENNIVAYLNNLERLKKEKAEREYNANDIVLIRSTDHLYSDHKLYPLSEIPFLIKINGNLKAIIMSKIGDGRPPYALDDQELDELRNDANSYLPYSTQYRSTIHFTLNGLVRSHNKGNFDNNKFIIIEPLAEQINKANIVAMRPEDTYIEGNMKLSNKAYLLVEANMLDELKCEFPFLDEYNIITYTGDRKDAVNMFLVRLGIIPETIQDAYIDKSETSDKLYNFIDQITEKLNISQDKHSLSKWYKEDDEKSIILWEYYDYQFYTFLLNKIGIKDSEQDLLLEELVSSYNNDAITKLLNRIGLLKFKEIVDEYNQNLLAIKDYPNNNILLQSIAEKNKTI